MSIFGSIVSKIFGGGEKAAPETAPKAAASEASSSGTSSPEVTSPDASAGSVDVEAILDAMPGSKNLNWRQSIVDLMKLLGLESSLGVRKELATELGYDGDMSDSASMNIWLHKQVMTKLAENGGKVPEDLKH